MTWFHATMAAILLSLPVKADEAATHARSKEEVERKVAEIERLGATLKPGDSKERVEEVMGKRNGGYPSPWDGKRNPPVDPVWWYGFWPTKDHFVKLIVQFDADHRFKSVSRKDFRAEDYAKVPLEEIQGTLASSLPEIGKELHCVLKTTDDVTVPLMTLRMDKVHGTPKEGSIVVVRTYGRVDPWRLAFRNEETFLLHSITFKDASKK